MTVKELIEVLQKCDLEQAVRLNSIDPDDGCDILAIIQQGSFIELCDHDVADVGKIWSQK